MHKLILIMMCLLMALGYDVKAQEDYTPFVVEGKVWNVYNMHGPSNDYWFGQYYLKGDTVINDVKCKKMYSYNVWTEEKKTCYEGAFFEKDRKVYKMHSSGPGLLYDFNVKAGDMVYRGYNSKENEYQQVMEVAGIEKHDYRNHPLTYYVMYDYSQGEMVPGFSRRDDITCYGYWIEGVGTLKTPDDCYTGYYPGGHVRLFNCVVNGDTLYSWEDNHLYEQALSKKYATGINTVKANTNAKEAGCYDLQGRPIQAPKKGLNIIRYKDGTTRKVMK